MSRNQIVEHCGLSAQDVAAKFVAGRRTLVANRRGGPAGRERQNEI